MNEVYNKGIFRGLNAVGISIVRKDNRLFVNGNFSMIKSFNINILGKLLFDIFKLFGKDNFLFFSDIPACILPEAIIVTFDFPNQKNTSFNKNRCGACKFLGTCPGWPSPFFDRNASLFPRPIANVPNEIVFELTEECNQGCIFCNKESRTTSIPWKQIVQHMDICKQLGVKAVRFTGGEPLLYKKLIQLLKEAKKRSFYVLLNTNANDLNSKYLTEISKYVDNVLVSLHGYDAVTESFLTGGTIDFVKKIKNILQLKKNVPVVRIGTIISKIFLENKESYQRLIAKILKMNIWELYRPMQLNHELVRTWCSRKNILTILPYLKNLHERTGMDCKIANPVPFCIEKKPYLYRNNLLGGIADDGHSRLVLDAKGFFKPSYFIDRPLGANIYEAWKNPFLVKLRSLKYLPTSCQICIYLPWCKGGSRSAAYTINGSYFAEDPWLKITKD